MESEGRTSTDTYGRLVCMAYIFNLIVGTGALTMPRAFSETGWLLAVISLTVLACISYLTATFMIEAMAVANAIVRFKTLKSYESTSNQQQDNMTSPVEVQNDSVNQMRNDEALAYINHDERAPLPVNGSMQSIPQNVLERYFEITEIFEMGRMASMFYNTWGLRLFYICITLYLYGDLAIYSTAVAKSLRDLACQRIKDNNSISDMCWPDYNISQANMYLISLAIFIFAVGPFTFYNVQRTKYLQISITILRWKAFGIMIVLCMIAIINGHAKGHPKVGDISEVPALFGTCVYSFMCHHSLPSLITPLQPKKGVSILILCDFILVQVFYNLLSMTGVFTFEVVKDLYTLNFEPSMTPSVVPEIPYLQYFLLVFPILMVTSNFPIIAITLTNNLRALIVNQDSPWWFAKAVVPIMALIPPCLIALLVQDVDLLVSVTGWATNSNYSILRCICRCRDPVRHSGITCLSCKT
ncbi:transmembrane protein 104 homolog isoform X2 [Varroa jacobsoni]|uniref:transmembrane protein 104 homolog isoform X2 n=1 Tax=Varroa jacobsoni TaxID=62625 RepID=UPI000BF77666|nr:transmembrane protein 104 homolog isoform X2 [Varroa jacobsoni]